MLVKRKNRKKDKKVKHASLKSLRKKAWNLQSEYIRRLENGVCFTCGDKRDWKEQQAGHYIHRDCLDYNPINIHCQCVRCNKWLSGNSGIYAEKLIRLYGADKVQELRDISNQPKKFTIQEIEELIAGYQAALNDFAINQD